MIVRAVTVQALRAGRSRTIAAAFPVPACSHGHEESPTLDAQVIACKEMTAAEIQAGIDAYEG